MYEQGVTDEKRIQHELDLLKYRAGVEQAKKEKDRYKIKDPHDFSVHLSRFSSDQELKAINEELGNGYVADQVNINDFEGIETDFKTESNELRR